MTTATETPSRASSRVDATSRVDAAREHVREATAARDSAAAAARAAAQAAKADPGNETLAEEARAAHNARRRAARALKKAEETLETLLEDAPDSETPDSETPDGDTTAVGGTSPASAESALDIARDNARRAEAEKAEKASATAAAEAAAEADPGNTELFAAARRARWDELKAARAAQKAASALAAAGAEAGAEAGTGPDAGLESAASATEAAAATGTTATEEAREVEEATEKTTGRGGVTAAGQDAGSAEPAEPAVVQPAAPAVSAATEDTAPQAPAADGATADEDPVTAAERRLAEATAATEAAEAEADKDPGDKHLAAVARRARAAQKKATRALKKARQAVATAEGDADGGTGNGTDGDSAVDAPADVASPATAGPDAAAAPVPPDAAPTEPADSTATAAPAVTATIPAPTPSPTPSPMPVAATAAPAAAAPGTAQLPPHFPDTLALVSSGASVLAVAADATERAAAADPSDSLLAEAARAARAAAQQAAAAVAAAAALHARPPARPHLSAGQALTDEPGQESQAAGTTPATTDASAAAVTEDAAATEDAPVTGAAADPDSPESPDSPEVTAARENLRTAEDARDRAATATAAAEAAAEADPGNATLFSAARKARWDELKAGKAVQKATAALEEALAAAPAAGAARPAPPAGLPAPRTLTDEEKEERRAPKPQGQWLIDGHRPLNDDERIKREDAGLAVADRVRNIYALQGFDSIPAEDLAPRFKWIGMYTQRRQDMDGEQTGTLSNAELQDRYFMMRIRLDGGQVTPRQLRVIGEISSRFARGSADFTDRQNIQLHWVRIEDVPEIWDRLAQVNLDTFFGCGDVPRVILGSPVAGISKDEIIDATPAIREIKENWLTREEFANLPRKFKSAISGNRRQDVTHEIQDISFIGSEHPEKGPGFDVWVGGGLSTNPMLSRRLGVWVPIEQVPEVWVGVVRIFRDYGYRKLRNRARLKFLVADWGIEKFRRILEEDYLGHPLTDGPAPEIWPGYRDHVGVHEQRNGRFYVGVKPTVGHTEGDQLQRLADLAEAHGVSQLRTTPDKELLFLDVDGEDVDDLVAALDREGLSARPSSFRRDIISCTGLEFCKLALVTTKARAIELTDQLEERLGDLDVPLKISLNGCPNSCARTQVADIGLKGQIVTDENGNRVEGFQVHLGGALGMHPDFGKKLRGHKVTSAGLDDYIVRVVEHYKEQRNDGEQFRDWVLRADEAVLQ